MSKWFEKLDDWCLSHPVAATCLIFSAVWAFAMGYIILVL